MQPIIHCTQLKTDQWEKIKKLELKSLTLDGYYTFPLYGLNQETVTIIDNNNKIQGMVAISDIKVEINNGILQTFLNLIPVIEEANMVSSCKCNGNCDCK